MKFVVPTCTRLHLTYFSTSPMISMHEKCVPQLIVLFDCTFSILHMHVTKIGQC